MTSRLLSLFIWLLVAASAAYWGLRLWVKPQPVPGQAVLAAGPAGAVGDLSRLLGQAPVLALAQPALVAAESRFKLLGVVAPRGGQNSGQASGQASGLALISVDGKPPRTVAVGREVEPGLRLLSVGQRQADLGAGGAAPRMSLTLPMLAEPNRGRPADGAAAQPAPLAMPGAMPGAQIGQAGGLPPNLPPAMVQRLLLQQQQMQLQQQQQAGPPMRAMPSEPSEDAPAPIPGTR